MAKSIRVVVTGGNGFLGQHIVKLLQVKSSLDIEEIIVFDQVPFKQALEYTPRFKCQSFVGDVTRPCDLRKCLEDVDAVIHSCGLISVGRNPDSQKMQLINVQGTQNIVDACIQNGVSSLVFTSTEHVVERGDFLMNVDESEPYPRHFHFGDYARTKCEAEKIVLKADKTVQANGCLLRTTVLRPVGLYGELDRLLIPSFIEAARRTFGYMLYIGSGGQPASYVGNAAWSHIKALETLRHDPVKAGGEAFFITDDTPLAPMVETAKPFLESRGYKLTPFKVPFLLLFTFAILQDIAAKLISPVYRVKSGMTVKRIRNLYSCHSFSHSKAEQGLGYKPLFSYVESIFMSRKYYDNL